MIRSAIISSLAFGLAVVASSCSNSNLASSGGPDGSDAGGIDASGLGEAGHQAPPNGTGQPCSKDSDCPSGICTPVGSASGGTGYVCTTTCNSTADCVPGWTCALANNPPENVCQCTASPETCDGLDNDCNGVVDDQPQADDWCESQKPGDVCTNGTCTCKTTCGGTSCIDTTHDPSNCGTCGARCPAGASCSSGACACPSGQVACNNQCVDEQTDNNNCGGCGLACPTGCKTGECVVTLVASGSSVSDIAVDATDAYYLATPISSNTAKVMKVSKMGGTPLELAATGDAFYLAVDASGVYWTTVLSLAGTPEIAVMTVASSGQAQPRMLWSSTISSSISGCTLDIALDTNSVYWSWYGTSPASGLFTLPKVGGTATEVDPGFRTRV